MPILSTISKLLRPEKKWDFILDKKVPGTGYYASRDGKEIAIKYIYTESDNTEWYVHHVWPKKIIQEGIEWEYLAHGSFNVAYRSQDGTQVLKIPRYTDERTDTPERAVRLWNELNPEFPAKLTTARLGWIAPYIEGTEPTQAEIATKLIDIYWRTNRIVVDASAVGSSSAIGNFKKVTLSNGTQEIICIDPGAAVLLTEEVFLHSDISLNFWKNAQKQYDKFLAASKNAVINNLVKALLYIDQFIPDYRVQLLETPQHAHNITRFAAAYEESRTGKNPLIKRDDFNHYEFYTPTELATKNSYAKKLVDLGINGRLFQVLFHDSAFYDKTVLPYLLQFHTQENMASLLGKITPSHLKLIYNHYTKLRTHEARDAYRCKLDQLQTHKDIIPTYATISKNFQQHELLFEHLIELLQDDTKQIQQIVSVYEKRRDTLTETQNGFLKKGFLEPALTLLLAEIRESEVSPVTSSNNTPQSNTAGFFKTLPLEFHTADQLKAYLREQLTLPSGTPLAKIYNNCINSLLDDVMWDGVDQLSALKPRDFQGLMGFIAYSFPLSSFEKAKKTIEILASRQPQLPCLESEDAECEVANPSQVGFAVTGY